IDGDFKTLGIHNELVNGSLTSHAGGIEMVYVNVEQLRGDSLAPKTPPVGKQQQSNVRIISDVALIDAADIHFKGTSLAATLNNIATSLTKAEDVANKAMSNVQIAASLNAQVIKLSQDVQKLSDQQQIQLGQLEQQIGALATRIQNIGG